MVISPTFCTLTFCTLAASLFGNVFSATNRVAAALPVAIFHAAASAVDVAVPHVVDATGRSKCSHVACAVRLSRYSLRCWRRKRKPPRTRAKVICFNFTSVAMVRRLTRRYAAASILVSHKRGDSRTRTEGTELTVLDKAIPHSEAEISELCPDCTFRSSRGLPVQVGTSAVLEFNYRTDANTSRDQSQYHSAIYTVGLCRQNAHPYRVTDTGRWNR